MENSFVTLGIFIIDEFTFLDEDGRPTGRFLAPQIGGGGTYAAIGARIWLPPCQVGMIVDKGHDFPILIEGKLLEYGQDMWVFRDKLHHSTTRAVNSYKGEHRGFEYINPRIRLTPKDLEGTKLEKPKILHFICSPSRALSILSEVEGAWKPITIFEPIPDRCVPGELPALKNVLSSISILSPNAEEALSLLSLPLPPSRESIELAADKFLEMGVGQDKTGWVIIRSGPLGSYLKGHMAKGTWVDAYWTMEDDHKIVDVTGAGNSFLGGLAAGIILSGDMYEAVLHATVSASFVIEQEGLPVVTFTPNEMWNGDRPSRRLDALRNRKNTDDCFRSFVTLGMFIIDEFSFLDEQGRPTGRSFTPQVGGGAYVVIGARIWLPSNQLGMIVDRGPDFPIDIERTLLQYGSEMWMFRDQPNHRTTRALNSFRGEHRSFEYKTPRIRLTPTDFEGTKLAEPKLLHFICSPSRALSIISQVNPTREPITIYEPIPVSCVPDELDELTSVLKSISIFSPNAEEALSLLSLPLPPTKELIELATDKFLELGVGRNKRGWVIIRSGALGAYMKNERKKGIWVQAYWTAQHDDKIVDVTGAGNSFLGGLAAGMIISGDMYEAVLYATVSASFIIEQEGLPSVTCTPTEEWNGDQPLRRLDALRKRHENTAN